MPVPQVFISSTYLDNKRRREIVRSAIETAKMGPCGMERFTADAHSFTKEKCVELAREADVVVAIIAWRYGWIPDGEERSITELECAAAQQVLWFVIDDGAPRDGMDPDDEIAEKWSKLVAFKKRIAESPGTPARFKDEVDLATKVTQALNDWKHSAKPKPRARLAVDREPRGPYPGLVTFEEADALYYFGREREVEDALSRISTRSPDQNAWLSIEGASGAGKSSLVRAGLIPQVRRKREGEPWTVALMRPGREPFDALARALAAAFEPGALDPAGLEQRLREDERALARIVWELFPSGGRLLLVIDQLEELFTHSLPDDDGKEPELERFTALLAGALADAPCPWQLVTTIRRDLIGELVRAPELDGCRNKAQILNLPPMTKAALRQTIERPAEKAELRFEPAHLPELIASEAAEVRNALPLLAYCLHELWNGCDGVLAAERYDAIGRVKKALIGAADALLERLRTRPVEGIEGLATWEDAALRLLCALVAEVGNGFARRRLSKDEAIAQAGGGELGRDVFLALSGGTPKTWPSAWPPAPRLVIDSGENRPGVEPHELPVELAHESLLTDWKRFRAFLARERDAIEWRDRLEKAARSWHDEGEPDDTGATGRTAERYEEFAPLCAGPHVPRYVAAIRREREAREIDDEIAAILSLREEPYHLRYTDRLPTMLMRAYATLDPGERPFEAIEALRAESAAELARVARRSVELDAKPGTKAYELERADDVHSRLVAAHGWLVQVLDRARVHAERVRNAIAEHRDELVSAWREVLDSIEKGRAHPLYREHGIAPRYDLLPLRLREGGDPNRRVWEFLVLGTGERPTATRKAGAWRVGPRTGIVLALAPGGRFVMGAEEESDAPPHEVTLAPFYIGVHAFTGARPDERKAGGQSSDEALPLTYIDWFDSLAAASNLGGALPSEAWWECACRAGTGTRYWSGNTESALERVAWYGKNSDGEVHPVGRKRANPWGLHDVHGNVREWCRDWHGPYSDGPVQDPSGPRRGDARVLRGGAYWSDADWCRSAYRNWWLPSLRSVDFGFRVAFPAAPVLGTGAVGD